MRLRLADWKADLAAARSVPGVVVATARVRAQVLLAVGTHVVPVEMVGVEPDVEPRTFRYVQHISEGRYLQDGRVRSARGREDDRGSPVRRRR